MRTKTAKRQPLIDRNNCLQLCLCLCVACTCLCLVLAGIVIGVAAVVLLNDGVGPNTGQGVHAARTVLAGLRLGVATDKLDEPPQSHRLRRQADTLVAQHKQLDPMHEQHRMSNAPPKRVSTKHGVPFHCTRDAATMLPPNPCPRLDWDEKLAEVLKPINPVFFNVGANKGYNTAAFLALHSQRSVNAQQWHHFIKKVGVNGPVACGMCKACHVLPPRQHSRSGGTAHLLELTKNNRALLRDALNASGLADLATVHDLGASNESAVVTIKTRSTGVEDASVPRDTRPDSTGALRLRGSEDVRLTSMDAFFDEHGLNESSVYHVSIDTEGHDALVLEGMRRSLREKRVAIVEFEYSGKGFWRDDADGRSLGATLAWLRDEAGYTCWWQTRHDLIAASPPCWNPEMETRRWANIVCVHQAPAVAALDSIATEGEQRRARDCTKMLERFKKGKRVSSNEARSWCGPGWKNGARRRSEATY